MRKRRVFANGWAMAGLVLLALTGCGAGASQATAPSSSASDANGTSSEEQAPPRPPDAEAVVAYYKERAPLLERRDRSALAATDMTRLRRGRLYFDPQGYPKELSDALGQAIAKRDTDAVLAAASKIVAADATDLEAHMVLAVAYGKLGKQEESSFHHAVAASLLGSIKSNGDGLSFDSAWTVYEVKEEYQLLHAAGFDVTKQSLVPQGDRQFDVLEVKDEGGKPAVFYFDVTELFDEEARMFAP